MAHGQPQDARGTPAWAQIAHLENKVERLEEENERLRAELDLCQRFHAVAVKERDLERRRNDYPDRATGRAS